MLRVMSLKQHLLDEIIMLLLFKAHLDKILVISRGLQIMLCTPDCEIITEQVSVYCTKAWGSFLPTWCALFYCVVQWRQENTCKMLFGSWLSDKIQLFGYKITSSEMTPVHLAAFLVLFQRCHLRNWCAVILWTVQRLAYTGDYKIQK